MSHKKMPLVRCLFQCLSTFIPIYTYIYKVNIYVRTLLRTYILTIGYFSNTNTILSLILREKLNQLYRYPENVAESR